MRDFIFKKTLFEKLQYLKQEQNLILIIITIYEKAICSFSDNVIQYFSIIANVNFVFLIRVSYLCLEQICFLGQPAVRTV